MLTRQLFLWNPQGERNRGRRRSKWKIRDRDDEFGMNKKGDGGDGEIRESLA